MKHTRATGTPVDAGPALPDGFAPALEAYLRACGVSSLILVSIPAGRPGDTDHTDDTDDTDHSGDHPSGGDGLVHLEHWQDIPRARAVLADHAAVAEVSDGPTTDSSLGWSLRFTLKTPERS